MHLKFSVCHVFEKNSEALNFFELKKATGVYAIDASTRIYTI